MGREWFLTHEEVKMSELFVVVFSTNDGGPYPPTTSVTYHRTREEASSSFQGHQLEFGEDYCSLSMSRLDLETMKETTLEFLEGNEDDVFGLGEEEE